MSTSPEKLHTNPRRSWLAIWLLMSFAFGIGASFIPWGSPSTFHGTGFPVFILAWERSPDSGLWLDYPNPLGFILNPLLIFAAGIIARLLFRVVARFCRPPTSLSASP